MSEAVVDNSCGVRRFRPEIEGLRAVAVLAVITNHASRQILPGGFLGVDIFFVISGFVITASLAARPTSEPRRWLVDFYARRWRRLTPALIGCVLITALVASMLIAPVYREYERMLQVGLGAIVGMANLVLHAESANYFGDDIELNPFTHLWSLGVEQQFYLLFPLLVLLSGLVTGARRGAQRFGLLVGSFTVASLILFRHTYEVDQPSAYFLMPQRFWEVGAGCLAWLAGRRILRNGPLPAAVVQLLHGLVVAALLLGFSGRLSVPDGALLTVVITCLLLITADSSSPLVRLLSLRPLVAVGTLSYSLYLWHWSVFSLARWSVGVSAATIPWLLLLIAGLSVGSWSLLERPLPSLALWGLGGAALLSALGPAHGRLYLGGPADQLAIQDNYRIPGQRTARRDFTKQEARAEAGPQRLFLIGDSHAGMLKPVMPALLFNSERRATVLQENGCPFPPSGHGHSQEGCFRWVKSSKRFLLRNLRPGDLIVISTYALSHLGGGHDSRDELIERGGGRVSEPDHKQRLYGRALDGFAAKVERRGGTIVLVAPFPRFRQRPAHTRLCEPEWFRRPPADCGRGERLALNEVRRDNEPILAMMQQVAARRRNVLIFDPVPHLCDGELCSPVDSRGERIFRDNDHISLRGAERLRLPLLIFLRQQGLLRDQTS
jgi:peptidoglycan/LPS O-acetylase OafA/YrhL